MAISTYKVFLMKGSGSGTTTYSKLIDIKDFPDLGAAPEQIETTTLTNKMRTYIEGIQDTQAMEFTCNYTKSDFTTLEGMKGTEQMLAVWFGGTESAGVVTPTGSDGKFSFKGYITPYVTGAGVNEVVEMKVAVTPSTDIKFE